MFSKAKHSGLIKENVLLLDNERSYVVILLNGNIVIQQQNKSFIFINLDLLKNFTFYLNI